MKYKVTIFWKNCARCDTEVDVVQAPRLVDTFLELLVEGNTGLWRNVRYVNIDEVSEFRWTVMDA